MGMNRVRVIRWLGRLIQWGLGAMFLYSSIPKIIAPADFLSSVYNYELLSPSLTLFVAIVLPWVEFLLGVCLLGGIILPGALVMCMVLFGVFVFAHASVLMRGLSIECGCGLVSGGEHVSYITLARSIILLLAAGVAFLCIAVMNEQT